YQTSKQEPKGPSAETDQAILAAAKRSVGSAPVALSKRTRMRWLVPTSVAATVVLSTSIYLTNQPLLDNAPSVAPNGYNGSAAESEPLRQQSRNVLSEQQSAKTEAFSDQAKARSEKKKASLPQAPAVSAPQPAAISSDLDSLQKDDMTASRLRLSAEEEMVEDQQPAARKDAKEVRETAEAERIAPQSSAMQAFKAAPVDFRSTPDRWLEKIEQLVKQGELNNALDELAAFQISYPEYPLPEQLIGLQTKPK
ncbi:MAG: hypothetical protein V7752_16880, partial [Halopseudomonas sp.]